VARRERTSGREDEDLDRLACPEREVVEQQLSVLQEDSFDPVGRCHQRDSPVIPCVSKIQHSYYYRGVDRYASSLCEARRPPLGQAIVSPLLGLVLPHLCQFVRREKLTPAPLNLLLGGEKLSHVADPSTQSRVTEAVEVKREGSE
jgi:hypothetical protein